MPSFKRMNLSVVLLAVSMLSFSSCSKKGDDDFGKVNPGEVRPRPLNFQAPPKGTELTKGQAAQLKATFSQKAILQIPPSELLLKDQDSKLTQEQLVKLQRQERNFKDNVNAETYVFYRALRSRCSKQHGTLNLDVTVPLEKITQASDVKTGDHLISSVYGEYGGAGCDAEVNGKMNYQVKAERVEKDAIVSTEAAYSLKALLKNPRYAQMLRSKGIIATSSISGVIAKQSVDLDSASDVSANVKFNINGSYFTLNDEIPVISAVSTFGKPSGAKGIEVQSEIVTDIKMPTFSVNVGIQLDVIDRRDGSDSIRVVESYYVNGYPKTKEELREIFGEKVFPAIVESNEMVQAFLN